ncbi:hypothetical protein niasHT_012302 [Heterodera trifolii]|uniref:Uncharacterized protein n=1 Tax=Heterodera trifolii TaxID=157864 RepID=A0ABD2LDX2_9BILA
MIDADRHAQAEANEFGGIQLPARKLEAFRLVRDLLDVASANPNLPPNIQQMIRLMLRSAVQMVEVIGNWPLSTVDNLTAVRSVLRDRTLYLNGEYNLANSRRYNK